MMDLLTLQSELAARDITLAIEASNLKVNGSSRLTPELRQAIRTHKTALLDLLTPATGVKQEPAVSYVYTPPPICRKCHNTDPLRWTFHQTRNRWVCFNCKEIAPYLYSLPIPTQPGEETERNRQEIGAMVKAREAQKEPQQVALSLEEQEQQERHTEPIPVVTSPGTHKGEEPMGTIHCAVLHDTGLTFVCASKLVHVPVTPATFEDIAMSAIEQGIRNIWVTSGCSLSEHIYDHLDDYLQGEWNSEHTKVTRISDTHKTVVRTREYGKQFYPTMASVNRLTGAYADRRIVRIFFPQFDDRWSDDRADGWTLADVEDSKTLLAALTYLHETLGIDIGAPGYTGIELMKRVSHSLFASGTDLTMLPDHREVDLQFSRSLTVDEQDMNNLHVYDRNSHYLAAATGAEIGEGVPEYVKDIDVLMAWDKHNTGVWHITVTAPKATDTRLMELVSQFIKEGEQWAYTPAVDILLLLGYTIEFHEAWVWTKTRRLLQPWGKLLWDTRQALRTDRKRFSHEQGAETARQMVKRIATQGLYWLDLQSDRKKVPTPSEHRPDIPSLVLALARYRMMLKVVECIKLGYYPVFGLTDGMAFVSNEPKPEKAIPELMIIHDKQGVPHDRTAELGGFKSEHTFSLTEEIKALFAGSLAPYQIKQALNEIARGDHNG